MSTSLGSAARGSSITFIGSVVSALAGFALTVVMTRTLGAAGSGIVFQMISVFTIAGAVAKLGLDTTAVWLLPRLAIDSGDDIPRAIRILLVGAALGGVAGGLVLLVLAPLLTGASPELSALTRVAAGFVPLSTVATVALAVSRGLGGVRDYVLIGSVALPVGRLVTIAVTSAFAASAVATGTAWLVVLLVIAAWALLVVRVMSRRFQSGSGGGIGQGTLLKRIATFAGPRAVSAGIEQSLAWLDVLIVGLVAGPASAGVYGAISRLVQAGTIPSTSVRIVVAPEFSRMIHGGRFRELDDFYTRTAQWIVLFSLPIYTLLIILGGPLLSLFGPGFEAGGTALAIMCIGAVVSACTGNVQSLLLMSGRSMWAALNKVIVLAVSVGLLLVLVPIYGIVGAAISYTISVSLDAILATIQVRLGVKIRLNYGAVFLAALAGGVGTGAGALIARVVAGETIVALAFGSCLGFVLWIATLYFMRERFALGAAVGFVSRRK